LGVGGWGLGLANRPAVVSQPDKREGLGVEDVDVTIGGTREQQAAVCSVIGLGLGLTVRVNG
jgi:hypothetical protein